VPVSTWSMATRCVVVVVVEEEEEEEEEFRA
jgi:hypothetical protein